MPLANTVPNQFDGVILNEKGKKNYLKMTIDGTIAFLPPPSKPCQECDELMCWQLGDPVKRRTNNRFTYNNRHNGGCVKVGQNNLVYHLYTREFGLSR